MSPLSIISNALQSIPPIIRKVLLVVWALAVVGVGVAQIVGLDTGKTNDVLLYLGLYLGVQSAANVDTSTPQGGE